MSVVQDHGMYGSYGINQPMSDDNESLPTNDIELPYTNNIETVPKKTLSKSPWLIAWLLAKIGLWESQSEDENV